jgi:hypothetical protein
MADLVAMGSVEVLVIREWAIQGWVIREWVMALTLLFIKKAKKQLLSEKLFLSFFCKKRLKW